MKEERDDLLSHPETEALARRLLEKSVPSALSGSDREGFKTDFLSKPGDPMTFKGAGEIKGGAVLHGGVEVELNPGGFVEVTPKLVSALVN